MAVMQRELNYLPVVRRRPARGWSQATILGTPILIVVTLCVVYALITTVVSWAQVKLDDIRYGYPRTFQTDGYIGYGEQTGVPTHFVVINAHRQVLILVVPGGDPGHVTVIKGPYLFGPGQEFSPATLDLVDVRHDGYPDLRLHVAGQTLTYPNLPSRHTFGLPHLTEGASR